MFYVSISYPVHSSDQPPTHTAYTDFNHVFEEPSNLFRHTFGAALRAVLLGPLDTLPGYVTVQ